MARAIEARLDERCARAVSFHLARAKFLVNAPVSDTHTSVEAGLWGQHATPALARRSPSARHEFANCPVRTPPRPVPCLVLRSDWQAESKRMAAEAKQKAMSPKRTPRDDYVEDGGAEDTAKPLSYDIWNTEINF